uniref:T cell surface glycoprotein CD4 n=1 Tax=Siniperca chuatsi TaxID=119488 RepID=E9K9X5_SINCH|nr:T cell surface glycoprotein CD4 [Siniperca chuatsi]
MKNLIKSILILIPVLMSTTGTEEVVYAQVGDTVTLKPPRRDNLKDHYLYWSFGHEDLQLAWRNPHGGQGFDKSPWNHSLSMSDDSLVIHHIKQEHFGTFICKLTMNRNSFVITYKLLKLNVIMNPPFPLLPLESLSLVCNAESPQSLMKPEIYWLTPQGEKIKINEGRLTMRATSQHSGEWTCVVTNGEKEYKATESVIVVDLSPAPLRPQYTSKSSPLTVPSPQSLMKPEIYWLTPQGEKIKINEGRLTMRATSQHSGEWTCVVTNGEKGYKATKSVIVVDLSPAPLRPQYTSKSSPLTVPCSIAPHISWDKIIAKGIQGAHWDFFPISGLSSAVPQKLFSLCLGDELTWKTEKNTGLKPVKDLKKGNLTLIGKLRSEEDAGDYVCALNFTNGVVLKRTVHVNVLQIISSPGTDFISGQQVNLTCSIGHPLPSDLQVKWIPPKALSLPSLRPDHHHLTIPEVGTGDSGPWRCELWQNSTLLTSATIVLKIESKLSVWMLVIICSVIVIAILLLVLIFILYRRKQRKMRHLRHRLCQCKNPKPKGFYRT